MVGRESETDTHTHHTRLTEKIYHIFLLVPSSQFSRSVFLWSPGPEGSIELQESLAGEGVREGGKEGGKERKEGGREGRREGRKGRREGGREGRGEDMNLFPYKPT